jgi:hypothetical protein
MADIFTEVSRATSVLLLVTSLQTIALLMTCDYYSSERLLYPEFREIRPEMLVNCEKTLRLRRESVITSGKGLFLLDSIRQIVLYRSQSHPHPPSCDHQTSSPRQIVPLPNR